MQYIFASRGVDKIHALAGFSGLEYLVENDQNIWKICFDLTLPRFNAADLLLER
jgi:hypothetical protein